MPEQPFHHGRLRAELLERAEHVVRDEGPEAVSLRELARQAGVSHAAPRRHFADRRALLDAVAEHGFQRLTEELQASADAAGLDAPARFRAAAGAYVEFAAREARVHDLMFATLSQGASESLDAAATRFFTVSNRLLAPSLPPGAEPPWDDPRRLLVVVALQGTAALVAAQRLDRARAEAVLDEAVRTFFG